LLLLRATAGIILIAQGLSALGNGAFSNLTTSIVAFFTIASGASVLFGFLTPVGSVFAALVSAAIALSWLPQDVLNMVETKPAALLISVIATAVASLGPGAYSVDSRLFGRREIVIPQTSRSTKS
jgi:uncharacterized membrane protein YphA (DoxX/SURF4 family)